MNQLALILIGLLLGAAINALADDLPRRVRPQVPHCEACGELHHPLLWSAVVAFLIGRGRCAHCGAPLRLRRVAVEIASAVLLVYLFARFGPTARFVLLAALLECLLLITVIDLEHRLILYVTIVPTAFVALLYGLFGAERGVSRTLLGGAVGFLSLLVVYGLGGVFTWLMARIRKQALSEAAFGGGDVNLAGVIGLAVGWTGIVLALMIAILSGGVGATLYLLVMLIRRRYSLFTAIPYGPFLVFGAGVVLLFDAEIKRRFGGV